MGTLFFFFHKAKSIRPFNRDKEVNAQKSSRITSRYKEELGPNPSPCPREGLGKYVHSGTFCVPNTQEMSKLALQVLWG
jgi:hypothetical protein